MKAYTDLEQSKKLAEILPRESADMLYVYDRHLDKLYGDTPYVIGYKALNENVDIPCWSLAALLEIIRKPTAFDLLINGRGYRCHCTDKYKSPCQYHHKRCRHDNLCNSRCIIPKFRR